MSDVNHSNNGKPSLMIGGEGLESTAIALSNWLGSIYDREQSLYETSPQTSTQLQSSSPQTGVNQDLCVDSR